MTRYITSEGGPPFTLAEFREANEDCPCDPEEMAAIEALAIGDSVTLAGFVGSETVITRAS